MTEENHSSARAGTSEPRWVRESVPRRLYKYMPYDAEWIRFVRALMRRRHLKFSTASSFNDPFEARPHLKLPDGSVEQRRAMLRGVYEEMLAIAGGNFQPQPEISDFIESADVDAVRAKFQDVIRIVLGQRPVACLAGTRRSILMWSLYASHHRGVCVHLSGRVQPMATAWPVVYGDDYPTLTVPWLKLDSMEFTRICVLRKAASWRHEQEYRLISPEPDKPSEVIMNGEIGTLPRGSIVGLTIGARMDDVAARDLAQYAMNLGLPVWRGHLSDRQYRLTFARLNRPS